MNPTYTQKTGNDNPLDGFRVGFETAPSFADIDGDGDLDAFIGENDGNINYFRNDDEDGFEEVTGEANPFDGVNVGFFSAPSFADVDGDGDFDAFIGESNSNINYFRNDDGSFNEVTGEGNPFDGVDVGNESKPSFADIDDDGDLDAFIGEYSGNINYFRNDDGSFNEVTGEGNPFDGVDVGLFSAPSFSDIDGDGDLDAFIGENSGYIFYFEAEAANTPPTAEDDSFNTDEDSSITITAEQLLDNDTDPDEDPLTIEGIDPNGTTGTVTDNGDGTFTYDPNGQFEDLNDGDEATDSFTYTISDGNDEESTATVTIAIDGVSDNSAPSITSADTAEVDENQTFAINVEATDDKDSQGDGLIYSISGEDAGLFNIDELGLIEFNEAPDFENPSDADGNNDYLLQVSVTDSQGLITSKDLTISVNDVEEDNGGGDDNGEDDNIKGTRRRDTIDGGRGNDTIDGRRGSDLLIGGLGEDSLIGGRGNDTLDGGNKSDFLDGGKGNDSLIGGNGNDTLLGGINQDTLEGGNGNDSLDGGRGKDSLIGGDGVDTLIGGRGADTLIGGEKNDTLEGGRGSDTFVLAPDSGTDTIIDFELNRDSIGLSDGLSFGDLSFEGDKIISNGDILAVLAGIDTTSLDEGDFDSI